MSSLAATRADGYYVPPEYYESGAYKKISRNRYVAATAAKTSSSSKRKLDAATSNNSSSSSKQQRQQQQQPQERQRDRDRDPAVVRFELPESGFCRNCGHYISKGTRFNAAKKNTGDCYFTTPIWEFHFKCRSCSQQVIVLRTNPANRNFDYVRGIRKKLADNSNKRHGSRSAGTAGGDLEIQVGGVDRLQELLLKEAKVKCELEELQDLVQRKDRLYKHDAAGNSTLRSAFRKERSRRKQQLKDGQALGWRDGIPLLAAAAAADDDDSAAAADLVRARSITYGTSGKIQERIRFSQVRMASIFAGDGKKKNKALVVKGTSRDGKIPLNDDAGSRTRQYRQRRDLTMHDDNHHHRRPDAVASNALAVAVAVAPAELPRKKRRRQIVSTVDLSAGTCNNDNGIMDDDCHQHLSSDDGASRRGKRKRRTVQIDPTGRARIAATTTTTCSSGTVQVSPSTLASRCHPRATTTTTTTTVTETLPLISSGTSMEDGSSSSSTDKRHGKESAPSALEALAMYYDSEDSD